MMDQRYYHIPAERLGESSRIPLKIIEKTEEVFRSMATMMTDCIKENNSEGRMTVMICPVGPVGQYPYFVEQVNRERIDLSDVWFFNMDEYLDDEGEYIDSKSPLSFRGFMEREVYGRIDSSLVMPRVQRVFPEPKEPWKTDRLLEELGGADIAFGGIGITGHLAFNEPEDITAEEFSALPTRVRSIAPETRAVNAAGELGGALESMPVRCVTIGMRQILEAKKLRLGVFRDWHRAVVRRAAYGDKTTAFPVTLVQEHPDAMILVNGNAAKLPYGG